MDIAQLPEIFKAAFALLYIVSAVRSRIEASAIGEQVGCTGFVKLFVTLLIAKEICINAQRLRAVHFIPAEQHNLSYDIVLGAVNVRRLERKIRRPFKIGAIVHISTVMAIAVAVDILTAAVKFANKIA